MAPPYRITVKNNQATLDAAGGASSTYDQVSGYLDRLMKLIPGEAVGLYLLGSGIIQSMTHTAIWLTVWSIVGVVAAVFFRWLTTRDPTAHLPAQWGAIATSSIAYVIWVYCIGGGPFAAVHWYIPQLGSLLVIVFMTFAPALYPRLFQQEVQPQPAAQPA